MVQLLNSLYLGAATPSDYGKAAGVVELLPFEYYLGAAVPSHGKPTINVLLSGVSPLTLLNAVSLNYIKAFGKCEQRNLPEGYTQVEYLETDGNSYIDTGVLLNNTDPFNITFQSSKSTLTSAIMGAISGGTSYENPDNICVTYNFTNLINSYSIYCNGGAGSANSSWNGGNYADKLKHTIKYTGLNIAPTIDGVAMTQLTPTTLTTSNATITTWLFGRNNTGSGSIAQDGIRIFDTNFYAKGHFIPCKRNSDNVLGMYDTVTGNFLTNAGTGTFTAGADVVPTPSRPIDIVSNNGVIKVKDDELPVGYKRLLDVYFDGNSYFETGEKLYGNDVVTMTLQADSSAGQNVFGAYSGNGESAVNLSLYVYATNGSRSYYRYNQTLLRPVLGTGKRTIRFGNGSTSGFYDNVTYDVEEFETTDTAQIGALPNSSSPKFTGYFYGNITIGNRLKYIPCERVSDSAIGYYETVNGEFLENQGTGTLTTSGYDTSHLTEICYDGTVETVTTKQAFVNDSDVVDRTGLNSSNGSAISNNSRCYVLFPCKAGVTYTAQTDTNDLIGGNFIEYRQPEATSTNFVKSLTVINDGFVDGVYKSHVVCDNDGWAGWQCKANKATAIANNWQITADTSTATCQPLLSVGTYKDVQNITNGAITRNVGVKVLTGEEQWIDQISSYNRVYLTRYELNTPEVTGRYADYFVSHFVTTASNIPARNTTFLTSAGIFFMVPVEITSIAQWKQWLADQLAAGTPVLIVYPLATPTTETVTGQTLTITQGTNIVTAEGSVDNLELEVSYKAYAEVTVEEIEAVNTDENVEVIIS